MSTTELPPHMEAEKELLMVPAVVTAPYRRARLASAQEMLRTPQEVAEGFAVTNGQTEMDKWMMKMEQMCTQELEKQLIVETSHNYKKTTTFGFLDIAPFVRNGMEAIYQDSFTQCFESKHRTHWNTSFYLIPLYYFGVGLRYFVLFPLRLLIVLMGLLLFATLFFIAIPLTKERKLWVQGSAVKALANAFLWSWCAVISEHGVPPPREPGQIYVANHTSVIDVVLLLKRQRYSLTGQAHTGVIGFFQNYILACLECLWFDRLAGKDRHLVAEKIKEHCQDVAKPPLLVFPEGTCVNNEYVIMFKRGAFDLGTSIVPVAIKYNKVFVDGFWNSKKQTFLQHLFTLMTSWAVVADIWYMDPQYKKPDESATAFAERVKDMIAKQANLISVPWDGYLKYFKPKKEMLEERRKMYAKMLLHRFQDLNKEADASVAGSSAASGPAAPKGEGSPLARRMGMDEQKRREAQADQDILQASRPKKAVRTARVRAANKENQLKEE